MLRKSTLAIAAALVSSAVYAQQSYVTQRSKIGRAHV